jgi:hypothetical protein
MLVAASQAGEHLRWIMHCEFFPYRRWSRCLPLAVTARGSIAPGVGGAAPVQKVPGAKSAANLVAFPAAAVYRLGG